MDKKIKWFAVLVECRECGNTFGDSSERFKSTKCPMCSWSDRDQVKFEAELDKPNGNK